MKKFILILFGIICITSISYADVYVIFDIDTTEVYSISQNNDTVIPDGMEIVLLKGSIKGLGLKKNPVLYKYIDGDFILNNEKINTLYQAEIDAKKVKEDMALINKKVKEMAFDALVEEGIKFKKLQKKNLK